MVISSCWAFRTYRLEKIDDVDWNVEEESSIGKNEPSSVYMRAKFIGYIQIGSVAYANRSLFVVLKKIWEDI